ncbi:MAG: DMT family transporter [Thermodesulfobacteriota bacterium]|nr:DMT family transporter [Thermodesulfobacteriota bacterium]
MTWFFLSLLTAMAVASCDTCMKKWFSHLSHYEMMLFPLVYGLPFLSVGLLFVTVPALDPFFYMVFLVTIPFTMIPMLMYMKAIKLSPLSLTVPYLAFTPVFMILTGYLLLGEVIDKWGIFGIGVVVAGGYVLNIDTKNRSLLAPFRAVFKETGSWLMLLAALMFSVSAVLGKLAILHSSVMFFQVWFFIVVSLLLLGIMVVTRHINPAILLQSPAKGLVVGILMVIHILCHGFAISMTKAAYMMSIKRLSILFSIIYGGLVFKEENLPIRFTGAVMMFAGACILLLMAD